MTIAASSFPVLPNWSSQGQPSRDAATDCRAPGAAESPQAVKNSESGVTKEVTSKVASLESIMAKLRNALHAVSDLGRWLDHVGSAAAIGVHAVSKQRTGVEIHTQEGDVIRINYGTRTEVNAGAARTSDANGSDSSASHASVSQRARLRISVDGDLNADELKAIDAVLAKVDSLAKDFFAGDLDKAFAQAIEFDFDSEQLANVAVRLSQRQQVSVVAAISSAVSAVPKQSEQPIELPAIPTSDTTAEANPNDVATAAESGQSVAPAVVSEAAAPISVPVDSANTAHSIARYVAKLTENLRVNSGETKLGLTFYSKLDLLIASIKAHKPDADAPVDAAANKLQDVAGKAALL